MPGDPLIVDRLRAAIEGRDSAGLTGLYDTDAVVRIIDPTTPPSRPRELRGRAAIGAYFDDICSRAMTHRVEDAVAEGDRLAFTQLCTYPDGARVACQAMLHLDAGRIARQLTLMVWDG